MRRLVLITFLIAVSAAAVVSIVAGLSGAGAQGCVNQGRDPRVFATVVCGMQRELSWKSENVPHLFRVGNRRRTHVAVAWPPYVVVNRRDNEGKWVMFRLGFRYDRTWHGYIFPTAALKQMQHPILY